MMTVVPIDCRMKDEKIGYRTADIQDGEHNFSRLELATRNQNGCSSPGCKS
jgi:hypothetical protein